MSLSVSSRLPGPRDAPEVTIHIGGLHAAAGPTVIKTLLGSCIAVCLYDPGTRVGGMNHFMLPRGGDEAEGEASRFGVHAMDCLIGAMMKLGADRHRFVAKVFGGAHVLKIQESAGSVPQQNIDFIRQFLADEGFPVVSEDVGGYLPRHVHFHTESGRAFMKAVKGVPGRTRLSTEEEQRSHETPRYGDVTLFD